MEHAIDIRHPERMRPIRSNADPVARARGSDRQLIRQHRAGDRRARELMIERYLPFATRLARRYRGGAESADDLVQIAAIGLVKAVDRWDPSRGIGFAAFAMPTILGELRHHFRDTTWGVRPPRPLQQLSATVERARDEMLRATGREPTAAQLAHNLGRSREDVDAGMLAGAGRTLRSLEAPAYDGHESVATISDAMGVEDTGFERADARATLARLARVLDKRERAVVALHFEHDLTQAEIARHVGSSQPQISRILRSALDKLSLRAATPVALAAA